MNNVGRAVEYGWKGRWRHLHKDRRRHERDFMCMGGTHVHIREKVENAEEDKIEAD
jgi:hypothetical protein